MNKFNIENISIRVLKDLEVKATIYHHQKPKGIVQIIHGLREHRKRYDHFAKFLNDNGYVVITSDNRSHGESINDKDYFLGNMISEKEIKEDQVIISQIIKQKYPNIPLSIFGHSFGSMIARMFLQEHDNEIEKLILSGTVGYRPDSKMGLAIISPFVKVHPFKPSPFMNSIALGKDDLWVVGNEKALNIYRKDPLTRFNYTNIGVRSIIRANLEIHNFKAYGCKNPNLEILSVTGAEDPITRGPKGLKDTFKSLEKIGYSNFSNIVYEGMKHEVLNELDKEKVYMDILNFLNKN